MALLSKQMSDFAICNHSFRYTTKDGIYWTCTMETGRPSFVYCVDGTDAKFTGYDAQCDYVGVSPSMYLRKNV